jgi:hypothetical protein
MLTSGERSGGQGDYGTGELGEKRGNEIGF